MFTKNKVDELIVEFHYYLWDDSKKDAPTTGSHITDIIDIFVTNNIIIIM